MNATGFDASTIDENERLEPLEWARSGGVSIISSLGVYRPPSQIVSQFIATIAGRYSQPFDLLQGILSPPSINRELLRWQPFWDELSAALDAYYEGDEHVFWEWVERHIGHEPDGLLREALSVRMPRSSKELYPHGLLFHLRHHKYRLGIIGDPRAYNRIRRGIKLYPSLAQALDVLCAGSETTREQMLEQRLQFLLHSEWDKPPPRGSDPDQQLVNEVGSLIRRQARSERSYSSVRELSEFVDDPGALAPYDAVTDTLLHEWLCTLARQRLTPREFQVFEMTLDNQKQNEIAAHLSISEGRVSQLLDQVHHKLADIA